MTIPDFINAHANVSLTFTIMALWIFSDFLGDFLKDLLATIEILFRGYPLRVPSFRTHPSGIV